MGSNSGFTDSLIGGALVASLPFVDAAFYEPIIVNARDFVINKQLELSIINLSIYTTSGLLGYMCSNTISPYIYPNLSDKRQKNLALKSFALAGATTCLAITQHLTKDWPTPIKEKNIPVIEGYKTTTTPEVTLLLNNKDLVDQVPATHQGNVFNMRAFKEFKIA